MTGLLPVLLPWRTQLVRERAVDAAIAAVGPQDGLTAFALVEVLAVGHGHRLDFDVPAERAGERGGQDDRHPLTMLPEAASVESTESPSPIVNRHSSIQSAINKSTDRQFSRSRSATDSESV